MEVQGCATEAALIDAVAHAGFTAHVMRPIGVVQPPAPPTAGPTPAPAPATPQRAGKRASAAGGSPSGTGFQKLTSESTVTLSVPGMMCMGSCGSKVKKALGAVAGVKGECVHVFVIAVHV